MLRNASERPSGERRGLLSPPSCLRPRSGNVRRCGGALGCEGGVGSHLGRRRSHRRGWRARQRADLRQGRAQQILDLAQGRGLCLPMDGGTGMDAMSMDTGTSTTGLDGGLLDSGTSTTADSSVTD